MKAKELIPILQLNPEAEVLVSTVDYYEKSYQDVGYERGSNQEIGCVSLNKKSGIIYLEGGEEKRI
ncbi:hypothetical protein [Enterococcus mundtii]|uniref:hypothetical protein n=1 Tax=Enterococcus mundtii TaxID=53346 RepID=UPI001CCE4DA5|nr:hypothetical protein [Enterococcus mundtii]UBM05157.1 hypothetical protein K9N66_11935 [Enterococcus mundtii]GKS56468.1 hypothetical protein EMLAB_30830 [Enterococcus mundtii]